MLTDLVRSNFSAGVRERGQSYFDQRRVKLVHVQPNESVQAQVQGTKLYRVSLELFPDGRSCALDVSCTCPYGDTYGDFCKHIWAALLAADHRFPGWGSFRDVMVDWVDSGLEYDQDDEGLSGKPGLVLTKPGRPRKGAEQPPEWMKTLQQLDGLAEEYAPRVMTPSGPLEPLYVIEGSECTQSSALILSFAQQAVTQSGRPGKIKKLSLKRSDIPRIQEPVVRDICLMLVGIRGDDPGYGYYSRYYRHQPTRAVSQVLVPPELSGTVLPRMFESGRVYYRPDRRDSELTPLTWDSGPPWELSIGFVPAKGNGRYAMTPRLQRESDVLPLSDAELLIQGQPSLFIHRGVLHRFVDFECFDWASSLRSREAVTIPTTDRTRLLDKLGSMAKLPRIEWPADWGISCIRDLPPLPELRLELADKSDHPRRDYASAIVRFLYDGIAVQAGAPGVFLTESKANRQILRQREVERQLLNRAGGLGLQPDPYQPGDLRVQARHVPTLVSTLLKEGWNIFGDQALYRRPGEFKIEVTTGIDWFGLDGHFDFEGHPSSLPELLASLKKGDQFVRLDDGSLGMIPEDWLAKHGALLELGRVEDGRVHFAKTQIGLLDALLSQLPEASFDANFASARQRLKEFNGVREQKASSRFVGELRAYQKLGLGWLRFLEEFEWGGCLADDMGLGKTIQVLALLAGRRQAGRASSSLAVVPKSLIFNWMREAERFAPSLRLLDYTGLDRQQNRQQLTNCDLVLTTYGTMRRDIEFLRNVEFHYVILDEAQAIKNPRSLNARAARLLRARQRLVMTGTPVENHLGDLWSLMDFLNPGMLGATQAFKTAFLNSRDEEQSGQRRLLLQQMLRPFILRRTKQQVAPELPSRSEQTIECEMATKQAALYSELRDHYRASLLARVNKLGLKQSKIHVLEALLRLRQAACHPGLIDKSNSDLDSGKVETLLPMLEELIAEEHKVLVFSQFTSMLALVRAALDHRRITYEYLDGKTQDRAIRVDRFQRDPACPLFLISLKAGGVGLNLTAADYVFILDPWWNPAVEAQAIDRTHRIGQDKKVIAYRLISRDTVEEKILELQKSKRSLAESIITEDNSLIQDLTVDDLKLLLS